MKKTIAVLAASTILMAGCGAKTDTVASTKDASSSAVAKVSNSDLLIYHFGMPWVARMKVWLKKSYKISTTR